MEIKFIGTGGAFDIDYVNSSALVTVHKKNYLVDCGNSVFPQLIKKNLIASIDGILITHLHDDHVGSLGTLGYYNYHMLGKKLSILLPDHSPFIEKFKQFISITMVNYETYIELHPIDNKLIRSIDTKDKHYIGMESFGYIFTEEKQSIVYSGDIGCSDFLFEKIENEGLVKGNIQVFHDISFERNPTHTFYLDLFKWTKFYSVYGYHCNPEKSPADNTIPLVYNESSLNF